MKKLSILFLSLGLTGCFVCTKHPAVKTQPPAQPVAAPVAVPAVVQEPVKVKPADELKQTDFTSMVTFEFDTINVASFNENAFDDICKYLAKTPSASLIVEGHTDNIGTKEHNKALGEKRAQLVAKKFADAGVTNKIETMSYGEEKPLSANDTEQGQAANRRVDVYIQR